MSLTTDFKRALIPLIDERINEKTKNCVRRKKMTVTTAPDGTKIGVTEAYGNEIFIPYVASLSSAAAGSPVWVEWSYSLSNMLAVSNGSGK